MKKAVLKRLAQVSASTALVVGNAMAQTDPVVQAYTDLGTKITGYTAGLVALAVIAVGIALAIAYVKKGKSAGK